MSDNWIALVPEDPSYVPNQIWQDRAISRFREIAPDADEINVVTTEYVSFFDCGANLEKVSCPTCESELGFAWWNRQMESDYKNGGFQLQLMKIPCCGQEVTLNELNYNWPLAFGRFSLDAKNPNIGNLDDKYLDELGSILGSKLRIIYRHI